MIDIGTIYEMYLSGEIDGDDEVALAFNPETGDPLSEPLVNSGRRWPRPWRKGYWRLTLQARSWNESVWVYYPKRSMSMMLESAREILDPTIFKNLSEFVRESSVDLKRKDATAVLQEIAKIMNHEIC